MNHEFEEICGSDGTVHILQHQRSTPPVTITIPPYARAVDEEVEEFRQRLQETIQQTINLQAVCKTAEEIGEHMRRPYHRTASNRKRRKRYYRSK